MNPTPLSVSESAAPEPARRLRLCLAASGGGHVRQLLDLEPVWRDHDYFFVTEDTALGRSLAGRHPVRFVDHYALGQARLGRGMAMLRGAVRNLMQSFRIIMAERPDVVISTGAGAVFFSALIARMLGAKFILIDSFARFDQPSKFARVARPFATRTVVQSAPLKTIWPDAELFDPLRLMTEAPPPKQPLLFATVGATLGFPRLVESVLAMKRSGALPERVVLQVGTDGPLPDPVDGVEIVRTLEFDDVQALLQDADFVVCHGGTGSLITALRAGCRVVSMPRRFDLGEHYDDHQEEITAAFAARGLIQMARESEDLAPAIAAARARRPVLATTDPVALIAYLRATLAGWEQAAAKAA
jgi:UDP-N-acetylglucosamine--N-acetylmuramyl-(pentapeptide) pyrophosphoryl-undecaprenol N-acetylglucosamine transferase